MPKLNGIIIPVGSANSFASPSLQMVVSQEQILTGTYWRRVEWWLEMKQNGVSMSSISC